MKARVTKYLDLNHMEKELWGIQLNKKPHCRYNIGFAAFGKAWTTENEQTAIIGIVLYLRRVVLDWKEFNDSINRY
jgi:hypothetical protein